MPCHAQLLTGVVEKFVHVPACNPHCGVIRHGQFKLSLKWNGRHATGEFRIFSPGSGQWIALPMWQALLGAQSGARKLFALTVSSWRRFPGVRIDQLDDERLLVICEVPTTTSPNAGIEVFGTKYYLTWAANDNGAETNTTNKGINVLPGNEISASTEAGDKPFAKVVLACLPPN